MKKNILLLVGLTAIAAGLYYINKDKKKTNFVDMNYKPDRKAKIQKLIKQNISEGTKLSNQISQSMGAGWAKGK